MQIQIQIQFGNIPSVAFIIFLEIQPSKVMLHLENMVKEQLPKVGQNGLMSIRFGIWFGLFEQIIDW